jgi:hypothetical protein
MTEASREFLVILDPRDAGAALAALRSAAAVTQVFAPRLAIVQVNADAVERLASIRGVVSVHADALLELPPDFTTLERTFAEAWALRRRPKVRPGDGESWDAPGYQPPDWPRRRS